MLRAIRQLFASGCVLLAAPFGACRGAGDKDTDTATATNATTVKAEAHAYPGYFFQKSGNKGVIVFMHGLRGGAEGTWLNSATGAFWPELVKTDPEFTGWDIYVYDFPTTLLKRSMSVDELSEDLRLELENAHVFNHRDVIFVCHSMGGLITRSFLQKYQDHASKVNFIYFFSTPTEGAEIAALAEWVSRNPQFGDTLPITDSNYLATQLRAWLAAEFTIPSYCAYEDETTVGQQVVPMRSAAALCNKPLTPISANHMQIVKPKGHDDKPHRALQNAFRDTRPVVAVDFPEGLTLRQAIAVVVRSDRSIDEDFRINYIDCDASVLDGTKMRKGPVKAQTRELLIEKLASRTEALTTTLHLKATKDEENAVYEIRCTL